MPRRDEIDILDIARLTPNVMMVDVIDQGRDFRYRYVGTRLVDLYGRDVTGARVGDMPEGKLRDRILDQFQEVVRTLAPDYRRIVFNSPDLKERFMPTFGAASGRFNMLDVAAYEAVTLPLGEDGRVDILLLGIRQILQPDRAESAAGL